MIEFTDATLTPVMEDGKVKELRMRFTAMVRGREVLFGGTVEPLEGHEGRFLTRTLYEVHRAIGEMQRKLREGDERLIRRLDEEDARAFRAEWDAAGVPRTPVERAERGLVPPSPRACARRD